MPSRDSLGVLQESEAERDASLKPDFPSAAVRGAGLPFCSVTLKEKWHPAGYPAEPRTLGEHLKKRRLDLRLTQAQSARRIGTTRDRFRQWEGGEFEPTVSRMPNVVEFLGADPRPEPASWAAWLVWYRGGRGLSQAAMARQLGVAPRTVWLWETGRRRPTDENLAKFSTIRR